jgi:Asp-tRNA(Asn)/Glu-tRNA(Gln) amidotransferase A subunit family amidase
MVGHKPTYSRVSKFGAAQLDWSVAHFGLIAATALNAAIGYAVLAGPDLKDKLTLIQPEISFDGFNNLNPNEIKIGVFWPW